MVQLIIQCRKVRRLNYKEFATVAAFVFYQAMFLSALFYSFAINPSGQIVSSASYYYGVTVGLGFGGMLPPIVYAVMKAALTPVVTKQEDETDA